MPLSGCFRYWLWDFGFPILGALSTREGSGKDSHLCTGHSACFHRVLSLGMANFRYEFCRLFFLLFNGFWGALSSSDASTESPMLKIQPCKPPPSLGCGGLAIASIVEGVYVSTLPVHSL